MRSGTFLEADDGNGIGKFAGSDDGQVTIRYFRGPTPDPFTEVEHPEASVRSVQLPHQTRAFVPFADRVGWRVGRIDGELSTDDGTYPIAFPKLDGKRLSADEFEVRWSHRVDDPFELLATGSVESQELHDGRLKILGGWLKQQAAARGVEGLFESPVYLRDYQLQAVSQVSSDAVRRYLLADEVGLGKTIEAGALVRQFLDIRRDGRVLVLAPMHLSPQWIDELQECFLTSRAHSEAWIKILDLEDPGSWPEDPVDFLVVDEAHHLGRSKGRAAHAYVQLLPIAHQAEQVLLLSATPVRSNEAGFLDLLHIVDPINYDSEDVDEFTRRVELRDDLANLHRALTPDIDTFDLKDLQSSFKNLYPDDKSSLESFRQAVNASDDDRIQLVTHLRNHLSETYRIHHRLIRTRRSGPIASDLTVRGRNRDPDFQTRLGVPNDLVNAQVRLLDGFHRHLGEQMESGEAETTEAITAFRDLAERCGAPPQALLSLRNPVDDRSQHPLLRSWITDNEFPEFNMVEMATEEVETTLAIHLRDITLARGSVIKKAVVFTMYPEVAQATATSLVDLWSEERVARHIASADASSNSDELERWWKTPECTVLVCDHSAEEGVNLQIADLLVHLDLPWQVARLEQRIGRCDRFAKAESPPIRSTIVLLGDQPYVSAWCEFVTSASGVFDSSVSSLQYVFADIEESILSRVLQEGSSVLNTEIETRAEELASELVRIDAHDSLDGNALADQSAWNLLQRLDDSSSFQTSLKSWFNGVNVKTVYPSPGVIRLVPRNAARPHVPFDLEQAMRPWMGRDLPLTRSAAVRTRTPPLRAGHPLINAIGTHLEKTDRGTAFAILRPVKDHWPPTPLFRSDFLVRLGLNSDVRAAAKEAGINDWMERLLVTSFHTTLITIHVDDNGVLIPNDAPPFKGDRRANLNLTHDPEDPERFARFAEACGDWSTLCAEASAASQQHLENHTAVASLRKAATSAVRQALDDRMARQTQRAQVGLPVDGSDLGPLLDTIDEPLDLDHILLGAGVVFLADGSSP